jgi:hypothetical protein
MDNTSYSRAFVSKYGGTFVTRVIGEIFNTYMRVGKVREDDGEL